MGTLANSEDQDTMPHNVCGIPVGLRLKRSTEKERATCINAQIWPPLEPKTANCVSSVSSNWFIRRITQV